jgi:hypothetical protein
VGVIARDHLYLVDIMPARKGFFISMKINAARAFGGMGAGGAPVGGATEAAPVG